MTRSKSAKRATKTSSDEDPSADFEQGATPSVWRVAGSLLLAVGAIGAFFYWQQHRTIGSSPPANVPPLDPPQIVTEGVDHEVVALINRDRHVVLDQPGKAPAWGNLGMSLMAHEFADPALVCFTQAEKLDPSDVRWPYLSGRAQRMSNTPQAAECFARAVALCGNTPAAPRLSLAELLLELYRLDEAEQHLLAYLSEHNGDPRARLAKARLFALRGNHQECLQELEQLQAYMESQPAYRGRTQPLLLLMSESLRRLGQAEKAEQVRRSATTQTDPSWPDPLYKQVADRKVGLKKYLNDADAMYDRRQYDQSIDLLQRTAQAYPESIWAKILLARALIRTGAPDSQHVDREQRLQRAVELLQAALKLEPNSAEAVFRLAVAKGYQGRFSEAADLYRRAIVAKPDFTMAYYNLAGLLWNQLGDPDGAIQAFEGAIRAQPDFVDGHYLFGVILMRQGRFAEAEQHFDTVVRLRPNEPRFRQALAEARQRQQGN